MRWFLVGFIVLAGCSDFHYPTVDVHCIMGLDSTRTVADTVWMYYSKKCQGN